MAVELNVTLNFCRSDAGGGCDAAADAAVRARFDAMDVEPADGECARLVKSMLCSVCTRVVPWSAVRLFFCLFMP